MTPRHIDSFVDTVQSSGFTYITAFDHVLGADRATRPNWPSRYDSSTPFHEVFVLMSYIAAISDLSLVVGALTLPQRQTALVAKQAAELDVLSGGRFRLGVALGWNAVEYECLGASWNERAAVIEEQVELLRLLWTQEVVSFEGVFHRVNYAGICPRPFQERLPLWMGAGPARRALERVGRLSDGWMCYLPPTAEAVSAWAIVQDAAETSGRDPGQLGLQVTVRLEPPGGDHLPPGSSAVQGLEHLLDQVESWREIGATHISVTGIDSGRTPEEHLDMLRLTADGLRLAGRSGLPRPAGDAAQRSSTSGPINSG